MRTVVQRVSQASVTIGGRINGQIGRGLLVLVGIEEADTNDDIEWLSSKIVRLRIFNDDQGLMNLSVQDVQGDILVVSQFTLHASTRKGTRPSFSSAARPEVERPLYEGFCQRLGAALGRAIQEGEFGGDMQVALVNDGPVTIIIDTRHRE